MTEQTEMFAKTELDEATAVLAHLIEERKSKGKSLATAETNYDEACERVRQQQHVVDMLQAHVPAAEPAPVDGEAEDCEDAEIVDEAHQIEGATVDLETGEVTSKGERSEGIVEVWWPETDTPVQTDVGPTTQYAELVADWIAQGDPDLVASDQIEEYVVVAVGDGCTRPLHSAIAAEDHGLEFAVVYGTAADLEADLRTCANCGIVDQCAMAYPEPKRRDGMGCGGNGWAPVLTLAKVQESVDPITGEPVAA